MGKFKNKKKDSFLSSIPTTSLENSSDTLTTKCKFNFAYFDFAQEAGETFLNLTQIELSKLLKKFVEFSKHSLEYWQNQPIGNGKYRSNVFEVYGGFPRNSDFVHPKHVPHQAEWARFRIGNKERLVGFIVPASFHGSVHSETGERFDKNTFYIVFLDKEHKFYKRL